MEKHRHGDVITVSFDLDFEPGEEIKDKALAYGEVTGHSHRLVKGVAHLFKFDPSKHDAIRKQVIDKLKKQNPLKDPMVERMIDSVEISSLAKVESDYATLTHEEHGRQTLSKGNHAVILQRSFIGQTWQRVSD